MAMKIFILCIHKLIYDLNQTKIFRHLHLSQNVRVQEVTATCNSKNKGLLRIANLHLEFCNGKTWVRLSEEMVTGWCVIYLSILPCLLSFPFRSLYPTFGVFVHFQID